MVVRVVYVQGYLAHKKSHSPRTLHEDYAYGHMVSLGGGAFSYERGAPALVINALYLSPV